MVSQEKKSFNFSFSIFAPVLEKFVLFYFIFENLWIRKWKGGSYA